MGMSGFASTFNAKSFFPWSEDAQLYYQIRAVVELMNSPAMRSDMREGRA